MEPERQQKVKGAVVGDMKPFIPTLLLVLGVGCGSTSTTASSGDSPPKVPDATHQVIFSLDMSTPLPLLTIKATGEEVARLKSTYASFLAEVGPPVNGVPISMRADKKGSLEIPWRIYLRKFAPPYPVRLMGVLADGTREVIHEEIFR